MPLDFIEGHIVPLLPSERVEGTPRRKPKDWHKRWGKTEPECGPRQWRTRDRNVVMNMADMTDDHLRHATRFALTKRPHASRLAGLLEEGRSRSK